MANEGMNRLARVIQGRMREVGDTPPPLDFGEIRGDMSLVTNSFPVPIPQKDYVICRSVIGWLQPSDRVLVAWVGNDACVIDIICPAALIGRDADV
jgi:hypothetical protein